ncbi:MAG: phosphatase PAP2 family protein [Nanoarchaeota archaeon]
MPLDDLINDVSALGGLPFFVVITTLLISVAPPEKRIALALALLGGLAACYGITALIRRLWFRQRPQQIAHKNWWQRIDASAFPSLHTMRAAFLATIFAILAFGQWLVIIVGILLIVLVAFARVHKKKHHVSDVVVGALIGILLALIAMVLMARFAGWF